ncbi:hypothetical protein KSP39_PZI013513 [Platanthera zijinensis]|uniref:Uncharacterized protein n=1 Tax=Platanthera zijinensis TaxID=2320716 RepID=A0AAP0G3M9_9ASPA
MEQRIEDYIDDNQSQASLKLPFEDEGEELKIRETKFIAGEGATGPKLCIRSIDSSRSRLSRKIKSSTIRINHRRLDNLLDRLTAAHRWREASGVLSLLFAGNPHSYSPTEDRKYVRIAMEIQKRFCRKGNYHNLIKSTFEIWSSKLSWYKKGNMKGRLLHLELALFYISQEKFDDAKHNTRLLVSDEVSEPFVNLIHGLILYQLWYAELPEEMQIKGFNAHSSSDAFTTPVVDGCLETEMGESSNGHDAVDIENTKVSSQHASESSFGNNEKLKEGKSYVRRKISGDNCQCLKDEGGFLKNLDNFSNTSIYFASGLDKILLPIQLKLLTEDPMQSILRYRKFVNDKYREAEKHLRLALHSTPPLLAAFLPLIQLLLLGDQVKEAFVELDKSCRNFDSTLPFRLKARFLQCFCSSEISMISICYEKALTRDPTCTYSMERLIKMHQTGSYGTTQLIEMLATHLDNVDGKSIVWEEFASCFLKLQTVMLIEDRISGNVGVATVNLHRNRIPATFAEGESRETWSLRFRWWASRHFGKSISISEIRAGECMLLQFKAACAAHLFGPNNEYVTAALSSFTQQANSKGLSYLEFHIKNAMNLREILA